MRTVLHHVSIGRRLTIAFGLLCILLVVVAGTGLYGASSQQSLRNRTERLQALREDVQELRYLDADISGWQGYIYAEGVVENPRKAVQPSSYNTAGLLKSKAAVYQLLKSAHVDELTPRERAIFDTMKSMWDKYFTINDVMFADMASSTPVGMARAYRLLNNDLDSAWSDLLTATEKIAASVDRRIRTLSEDSDHAASIAHDGIVAAGALAMLLAAAMGLVVTRSIVLPLRRCVAALSEVAAGDLTASPGLDSRDEVGQLAASLDEAMASLRGIVGSVAESSVTLIQAAQEIATVSDEIHGSAQLASDRAQRVAAAAEQVSHNVHTVAAGSEEVGISIQEIARGAQDAVNVATEAALVTDRTALTVGQLGDSSIEIGNVVKVISAIAEQTNMLALNATIEAARAGAAGKGFAVVANEVKELARQTATATSDITGRVQSIQADASGAVAAIADISAVILRINDSQSSIASAVEEQTATTQEMNRNVAGAAEGSGAIATGISEVASASQVTASGVQQLHRSVAVLSSMSSELQNQVERFRY